MSSNILKTGLACLFTLSCHFSGIEAQAKPRSERQSCRAIQTGEASWYGDRFRGRRMANGQRFNPDKISVAHRTLPLGTMLRISFNGTTVPARVTDRGPYVGNRVVDLSERAAEVLGLRDQGVGRVIVYRCS